MLVGGDFGFWFQLVLGFIAVLFPSALGLLVRHKWRQAVVRKEEINKLCDLASKESALAELQSNNQYGFGYEYGYGYEDTNENGYGYAYDGRGPVEVGDVALENNQVGGREEVTMVDRSSQKVMHPCARCSCQTNRKCARCKSVYYCSGKCQIVHWRQGHKDDCQPYNLNQKKESAPTSHLKVSKQEENELDDNSIETGEDTNAKPAETSSNSSKSVGHSSHVSHSSHSSSRSSKHLPAKANDIKIQTAPPDEPSTSTSDFWEGKLVRGRCKTDSPDETEGDISRESLKSTIDGSNHVKPMPQPANLTPSTSRDTVESINQGIIKSGIGTLNKLESRNPNSVTSKQAMTPLPSSTQRHVDRQESMSAETSSNSSKSVGHSSHVSHSSHSSSRSSKHLPAKADDIKIQTAPPDEPSTSTSDFWEGKLVQGRCKTDSPDEIEGDVSRESLKSTIDGSNHVKPMPQPANLTPSTSRDTIESINQDIIKSGIGTLNKLESRNPNSVTSKQAMTPLPSSTQRHVDRQESMSAEKGANIRSGTSHSMKFSYPDNNAKHAFKSSMGKVVGVFKTSTPLKQHTRGSGTEVSTKYKGLFPYELFMKLYNWKEVEFRPCGFVNCGNSCYANAVLQCLASTPPLTSYFLQGLHSKSCEKRDWCFTCEFESLMLKAKDGASPLSPIRIISHLQNIGSHLRNGREEDAHEFLRYAIDAMQSISLTEARVKESGSLEEGTTLVGLTFGGIIRSKIECMRCGGKSARQERMMDLTVEIDGDVGTLEEALKKYTSVETLDGDNKYKCGRCKSYEKAKKKLKVMEAPNILTIALKRYRSGEFGKLNKTVRFPEVLNLAPYIRGTSDKSPIYGLYGVIVHLDTTMNAAFSGHYVCYVKNTKNQWFMLDDSVVKKVDIKEVLTKDAYMLLYARYSPRAPRLVRSSVIPRDPRNTKSHMCKSPSLSRDSWGISTSDEACHECANSVDPSLKPRATNYDYVSSSDNSSFFSESGSYGTDNSNRDSISTNEHLDFGMMGAFWNNYGSSSSDSDTSSPSSSLSPCSSLADGSKGHRIWRSASNNELQNSNCKEEGHFQHLKQFSSSSRDNEANRLLGIN